MFRNKVLVRAAAASPSSSSPLPPFLLRQLSLSAAAAPIAALDLEILCCRLSRRHRLACLPQPPADALLVFQGCQSREAAEAVSEIAAAFPGATVGEEEELVCSGELVAKAVGCELRSMLLEHGWTCLGESIYVDSKFHQSEERTDLSAVNVEVRLGRNDDFEFVVSPDAFRYTTHKISDVASPNIMETFQHSNEVVLDICNFLTVCTTLPALQEGHVIGYSKMLPSEQCLDKFMELCLFKEQVLLNCSSTLPTWDKAASNLILHSSKKDNIENLDLGHTNIMSKDFRTPKPAVLCSLRAKLLNTEVHKAAHSSGDNANLSGASPINDDFQSQLVTPNSSYKYLGHLLLCAKILCSTSYSVEAFIQQKHFSLTLPLIIVALEHPDADNSNKTSHPDAVANHANPVSSSSAILDRQVIQVSENLGRNHAELLKARSHGGGRITRNREELICSMNKREGKQLIPISLTFVAGACGMRPCGKDYTPSIQEVTKAIPDIEKDVLTPKDEVTAEAKRKANQDLDNKMLTAVTKQKTIPEVVKNEFAIKARENQNDGLNKKVSKSRAKAVDKDLLNSTRTKAKPDVASEELIAKVVDHHRRGELRLLTVADLKCFLSAKKAKVGGTKEVLIQRVTELIA
ncbi:uncharacterized protein C2845_PM02G13410 [Panicum miliaceum]|uniref:SAP domain-containing protein n=1 Tax=Panicum miliaceum TaxID=4540 RepID=A0A3L6SES4_PANMI|nr:uncharacterized protein C2845_PM02G13410 [Panicum miliaceum]